MGAFKGQVERFTVESVEAADAVVRETVAEIGRRLISRSPVDTGRFRSNWRYGAGAPDIMTTELTNVHVVNGIGEMPLAASAFNHFISNSLPYATALERGHSKQAPQGMVGLTALEFDSIIAGAVAKVAS